MPLSINFNHNWSYCQQTTTANDSVVPLTVASTPNHSNWFPLQLPHVVAVDRKNILNNSDEKWWYRKQFQLILSDQQLKQPIILTFKPSDDWITSSISAVIWLDTVKIFSDSIRVPQISIELPQIFLNADQMKNPHHQQHTLIVCCMNSCLSFNAFLTVPSNTTCIVQEVLFNAAAENTTNLTMKNNDIYDYVDVSNTVTDTKFEKIFDEVNHLSVPLLTIAMLIVGSRGDVQPFIAYGRALRAAGHRVRLATHEKFRKFVRDNGLEFFPLSGDPTEMMSFMVENAGIIPSVRTMFKGNLFQRLRGFTDILDSTWLACISDDDETGAPFRAEAIIANPLSYGHVHCAQSLGIPLHMAFTMPSSPTGAFPHPLSSFKYSGTPRERLNIFSYNLVETVMWAGIGDRINDFRCNVLNLPTLHIGQATSLMLDEKVPFTFCWSPSLVPKPPDWPHYIDVSGYFFLDLATRYTEPPHDLLRFLGLSSNSNNHTAVMSPPIFIGFGSITGHDSQRLLKVVLDALTQTGYRAILSGFNGDADDLPETIFKIDDVPYDWLFQHVSAVCHHGGAGTTAAGLLAGKPTIVVPFFGDQFFWGHVVEKSGVGPAPLPGKYLTVEKLVEAFKFVHQPVVQNAAKAVQEALLHEDGCAAAVRAFHANLPLSRMRSDLEPTFPACFRLDEFNLQVSRPVAQVLLLAGVVDESQFEYHHTREWQSGQDDTSGMHTRARPNTSDFQLRTTTVKPTAYYGLKNEADDFMNQSRVDLQQHNPSDISVMLRSAADISGFSPRVCEHILYEFTKLKRRRQQIPSFSLTKRHRSNNSTIRRSEMFTSLLALSAVLAAVICNFSAVLLDMSVYDKIPPVSDRFRILPWLFSRWL